MVDAVHDNTGERFYIPTDQGDAELLYRRDGDSVTFYRTYVPPEQRKHGLAERLVRAGLDWARQSNLEVHATCWYVQKFL